MFTGWSIVLFVLTGCLFPLWKSVIAAHVPLHEQPGVVALNDESFEHSTQASTGQTTGSWFVWFHNASDTTLFQGDFPDPNVWSELRVVVASVNVDQGGSETFQRFQVKRIPSFVYVHKGKLYRYPLEQYSWPKLVKFVQKPATVTSPEDVPEPVSLWKHLRTKIRNDATLMLFFGGIVMVVVLGFFASSLIELFKPRNKEKEA